jgi:hypothetical protein
MANGPFIDDQIIFGDLITYEKLWFSSLQTITTRG